MNNEPQSRRQWLTATLRWSVAGLLATGATVLMLRKSSPGTQPICLRTNPCQSCGQLAACQLPAADAQKRRQGGA